MTAGPEMVPLLKATQLVGRLSAQDLDALTTALEVMVCEPDTKIVSEGADDRAMYILGEGSVRIERGGAQLGRLGPGEHFGELALITGERRTASVISDVRSTLLILHADAFERFTISHPRASMALVREIVAVTANRLARMNETVGLLLSERSLPRRIDLRVDLQGEVRTVRSGTPISALLPHSVDGAPVVAGLVDGRARSLSTPLAGDCSLRALPTSHWEGQRIYRRSLALALLEAAKSQGINLRIGPSLGFAQRVEIEQGPAPEVAAAAVQAAMHALVLADAPLVRKRLAVLEAVDYFERIGWTDAARLIETTRRATAALVSYGELFIPELGPLLPRTGGLSMFQIVSDEEGLLLVYAVPGHERAAPRAQRRRQKEALAKGQPPVEVALEARNVSRRAGEMTAAQRRWLDTLDIHSVGDFNHVCIQGEVGRLIRVAEGLQEKTIGRIADRLVAEREHVRLVCIAGPSSSGKSTFIKRLSVQLQVEGIKPRSLSLDDYYVNRDSTPRHRNGELDFEAFEALQIDRLRDDLQRLSRGERVTTPRYDFPTGRSFPKAGPTLRLAPEEMLMIEGIHGLNPGLLDGADPRSMFRIFVSPLALLSFDRVNLVHASDLRLLRRIVRDRHRRALSAAETIQRWPLVREGEREHILPYQGHADAIFDTSLIYEISVLKVFAERYLLEVPSAHPAQVTAERLLALLDGWVTIYPDHVPQTSLLREFIGGSGFAD